MILCIERWSAFVLAPSSMARHYATVYSHIHSSIISSICLWALAQAFEYQIKLILLLCHVSPFCFSNQTKIELAYNLKSKWGKIVNVFGILFIKLHKWDKMYMHDRQSVKLRVYVSMWVAWPDFCHNLTYRILMYPPPPRPSTSSEYSSSSQPRCCYPYTSLNFAHSTV